MEEIVIRAAVSADETTCTLTVDRPIYPQASYYFGNKEKAKGSPLVEKIFDMAGITSVLVAHDCVTVSKNVTDEWVPFARRIGALIREQIQSGVPGISEVLKAALPPEAVIHAKVQSLLDTAINPMVAEHGGVIDLVDVKANTVFIRMGGGCHGCGMASATLKLGVERLIRQHVPEVGEILDTTDHAEGRNPYYQPSH